MLSGLNVLLAEDNPTNQLVASQMLESLGASVAVAADGVEALEKVREAAFDVLLVDIEMPRMNGIELMRRLRADDGALSALPMIALTAYVMREHLVAIQQAGADGVIAKPIQSIEQFGTEIRNCMAARATRERAVAEPPPTAAPKLAEVIDHKIYDALAQIIGPAALIEFLGKVGADLRAAGRRLEAGAKSGNLDEVRAATHVLISVAGTIGAVNAQALARDLNNMAHAGDAAAVRREAPGLIAETARVAEFVDSRHAEAKA